jgi:DNA anti-recombination protein RmuC
VQSLGEHARSTVDAVARQTGEAQAVLSGSLESLANDSSTVAETSTRAIEEASRGLQKVSAAQTHVAEGLEEALTRTVGDMKQRLSDMADVVAGEIQQHGKRIEEELEKALVESIGSLGDQLVTINQKVAQDYEPLTENLAKLFHSLGTDAHAVNGVS